VEVAAVFPGALDEVDAVVEGDGPDGSCDPDARAGRIAQAQRIEVARFDPQVAGIEK